MDGSGALGYVPTSPHPHHGPAERSPSVLTAHRKAQPRQRVMGGGRGCGLSPFGRREAEQLGPGADCSSSGYGPAPSPGSTCPDRQQRSFHSTARSSRPRGLREGAAAATEQVLLQRQDVLDCLPLTQKGPAALSPPRP